MFRTILSTAAASLILVAVAGCTTQPPAAEAAGSAQPVADKAPAAKTKTCTTDYSTGSHIDHKTVCLSDDEDEREREDVEESLQRKGGAAGR
ncbi:MAG: hypothetical protein P4L83_06710 [Nevskia sp.]|nr:hypothetical protein [Nevskia sp.]